MQEITCWVSAKYLQTIKKEKKIKPTNHSRKHGQDVTKNPSFLKEFISIRYKAALSKHSKSVLTNCVFIRVKVASYSRSMTSGGCLERSHLFVHTSFCLCKIWKGYLPPTFKLQTDVTCLWWCRRLSFHICIEQRRTNIECLPVLSFHYLNLNKNFKKIYVSMIHNSHTNLSIHLISEIKKSILYI